MRHSYKGANSGDHQKLHTSLLIYLNCTKQEKEKLKKEEPEKWALMEDIRNMHSKLSISVCLFTPQMAGKANQLGCSKIVLDHVRVYICMYAL